MLLRNALRMQPDCIVVGEARGGEALDMLHVPADALREAERRQGEADARRLPILLRFPLTFGVLPALLIVFLGPPLLPLL